MFGYVAALLQSQQSLLGYCVAKTFVFAVLVLGLLHRFALLLFWFGGVSVLGVSLFALNSLLVLIMYIWLIRLLWSQHANYMRTHMPQKYRNVSIPEELYTKLETLVETKQAGYVSVSDAVKDAIRELLRKHQLLP